MNVHTLVAACPDAMPASTQRTGDHDETELLFVEGDSARFVTYVGWADTIDAVRTREVIVSVVSLPVKRRGRNGRFISADDEEEDDIDDEEQDNNNDDNRDGAIGNKERAIARAARRFFKETSALVTQRGFER